MGITRRELLRGAAAGLTAIAAPPLLPRSARAGTPSLVLVAIFQRGAADALSLVVPHGDGTYYDLRPTIRVTPGTELDLDGFYGFHPNLAPLLPLFQSGKLAVVHAAGSPSSNRSHFDSMDFMERAAPDNPSVADGWLNRFLGTELGHQPHFGVSIDSSAEKSLVGPVPTLAFSSIASFNLGIRRPVERTAALRTLYQQAGDGLLSPLIDTTFDTVDLLASVDTATAITYPGSHMGMVLKEAAALIKAEVGVKVIAIDTTGWDHHSDLSYRTGQLATDFADSLAAFEADLGSYLASTLTLCMTEFGRAAAENGGLGADHGHGSCMFAMGGGIAGGRVITAGDQWPGLLPGALFEGRDLAVTTDFRNVLAESLAVHMGATNLDPVFPGFAVDSGNFPGLWI